MLRRLVSPTNTRARIYDRDGGLLVDSRNLLGGDVLRFDLPPPNAEKPGLIERAFIAVRTWLGRGDLPLYRELGAENGKGYPEVSQALNGQNARKVRINEHGDVIVSVAVPVQQFRRLRRRPGAAISAPCAARSCYRPRALTSGRAQPTRRRGLSSRNRARWP